MIRKVILLIFIFASVAQSQSNDENNLKSYSDGNQHFAKAFYNEIIKDAKNNGKSFVYSPFSIQAAGALLYAGADGDTAKEILNGFRFGSKDFSQLGDYFRSSVGKSSNTEVKLFKSANKIYIQNIFTIAPKYKDIVVNNFNSDIESINFEATEDSAKIINNWVEDKTDGKIKDFVSPSSLGIDMRLFLLNAIHFKGFWNELFDKNSTIKRDFYTEPNRIIQIDSMRVTSAFNVTFSNDIGVKAIDLPFKDSDLSLFIVSPVFKNESLKTLEDKLNTIDLKKDLFDTTSTFKISAKIPKFKIESEINMEEPLRNLGMTKMFTFDANFNNILESSEPLSLSKAIHKAVIEVNEEGAEAAAASAHGIRRKSGPLTFNMNQSFIYFIKNLSGQVYFMGRFTGE